MGGSRRPSSLRATRWMRAASSRGDSGHRPPSRCGCIATPVPSQTARPVTLAAKCPVSRPRVLGRAETREQRLREQRPRGKRATLQPRAARVMSNYAPMETDLNGRHSPPGAYAVAPPAPHIALPKRPAKLGSSGRPITLVANHFFVDVRRMVELSLYDVTITPPAAPVRQDAPPGRGPPRQQERVLPARLCRCAPRPPRPRPPERHGRVPVDTSEPPKS